ncbi:MAG: MazG nucleotide pyrophosphohydrolase domain-containing protein, partial [Actinomycetota bacterium]
EWRSLGSAMDALREEIDELARVRDADEAEAEIGDVLFATAAVARKFGVDAESALRRTISGFADRYERFMAIVRERGLDVDAMPEDEVRRLFRESR